MYFIVEKFSELMGKEIASQTIWDHLDEMYDMDTLVSYCFLFLLFDEIYDMDTLVSYFFISFI